MRAANRRALQKRASASTSRAPLLIGVVSRLTWQKGLDLLLAAIPAILARGASLAVLGAGDPISMQGFIAGVGSPSRPGRCRHRL